MREAFVLVPEQRQAEHRKCGHGNDRDVTIGLEERRVESETEPVETFEPKSEATARREGPVPLDTTRLTCAEGGGFHIGVARHRGAEYKSMNPSANTGSVEPVSIAATASVTT
jgi:hypothetical protein